MAINQQTIEGSWNQVKGMIRQRWGEISDDELDQVRGSIDQVIGLIQRKTGEARDAVEAYLDRATGDGDSAVSRTAEAVRQTASHAADTAYHAMERLGDSARAGYQQAGRTVRERPVESLAVCFGVGLIVGVVVGVMIRSD